MDKQPLNQLQFDADNLYREETFTDLKIGSIQRLVPIRVDGADDPARPARFMARTQIMSEMGPLPVQAPIEAGTLEEAISKFPAAIQDAVEEMVREAEAMRREQASRLVVPGRATPDLKLL